MTFKFNPKRTLRSQLEELGVDWDAISAAADELGIPELALVQFWLDLYGEGERDPDVSEPDWADAIRGLSEQGHSAQTILRIYGDLGNYDPDGEYGGRGTDAAYAFSIAAGAKAAAAV